MRLLLLPCIRVLHSRSDMAPACHTKELGAVVAVSVLQMEIAELFLLQPDTLRHVYAAPRCEPDSAHRLHRSASMQKACPNATTTESDIANSMQDAILTLYFTDEQVPKLASPQISSQYDNRGGGKHSMSCTMYSKYAARPGANFKYLLPKLNGQTRAKVPPVQGAAPDGKLHIVFVLVRLERSVSRRL